MNCKKCEKDFNIYMFAYKQERKCPECGRTYIMEFPYGIWMISLCLALFVIAAFPNLLKYSWTVLLSFYFLFFYVIDVFIKFMCIVFKKYSLIIIQEEKK